MSYISLNVFFERRRNTVGTIERGQLGILRVLYFRELNSPLDFAHRIEISLILRRCPRPDRAVMRAVSAWTKSRMLRSSLARLARIGCVGGFASPNSVRTPRVDSFRTAEAWSAKLQEIVCCRRSYSPNRSRPPCGRLRGPVRATARVSLPISLARSGLPRSVVDVGALGLLGMHSGEPASPARAWSPAPSPSASPLYCSSR